MKNLQFLCFNILFFSFAKSTKCLNTINFIVNNMRWYSYSLAFFVVLISLSYVVSADLLVTAGWDSTKARLEVKNPDDLSTTCTYLASAPGGRATHMYGVAYVPTDGTVVMAGYWDVSRDWRYVKVRVTSGVPCSEVWSIEEDVPLSGYANAIVYGNGYVYAAGFDALSGRGNRIRVEKRDAITGALMWNYTSDPTTSDDVANAIAFDKSGYVYIAGTQGARAAWRIEKIDVTTGALVWAKTNSPPTAGQNNAEGIVFDPVENVIYVVGSDNFGSGRIRVEKRSAVTGDLVPGTSVYTNDPSVGEDRMLSAVFYNNYLYMGGWQRAEAIIRAEKLTSSLTNSWSYINDPGTSDVTRGLAVGGGSVYLSGSMSNHLALYDVKVDAVTGLDITKIGYKPGHEINWEASTYIITCTDADGDGYFAEGGTCGSVDCNDNNAAVHPGATEVCNGIDDNCNGQIDEEIAPIPTSCGVGACRATGTLSCVNGAIVDSCTVGAPAANDVICNGIDDDCDEQTDEDYASHATSCGIGACKSAGATSCVAGAEQDSCTAGTPSSETCNGIDDDCDGVADEDFPLGNACSVGIGACQASGIYICSLGNSVCSANEGIPSSETCNGIDDDCDGVADDGIEPITTSCGVGACQVSGTLSCVSGALVDSCTEGTAASDDTICNGIDDDCDGQTDEDYVSLTTNCGIGACESAGATSCVNGAVADSCTAGTAAADDATCNGIDDNCNGQTDEDYILTDTSCGVGACSSSGQMICSNGLEQDTCHSGIPADNDFSCDGVDNDCDGSIDENYASHDTSCGIGACAATGITSCANGIILDSCTAGTPAANDATCDGIDDNCDGLIDENYASHDTSCGIGACGSLGTTSCEAGVILDSCTPSLPAIDDASCDGLDNDCDGFTDEDYVSLTTNCGVGVCRVSGTTSCISGNVTDSCVAGTPGADDANCDGMDNDCDEQTDEGYVPQNILCGVGACTATIVSSCSNGVEDTTCTPGAPSAEICNGKDDDCDGSTDENLGQTTCGLGQCYHTIENCAAGVPQSCDPMQGATTETCNGKDDDCDGQTDEGYDADKDGVNDCGDDLCLNTTTDTRVPLIRENPNHHVYVSGYPWYPASFTVNTGSAKKPVYEQSYSIVQTRGCSCEQILDAKYGNTLGQYKYTCTKGTMDNWIQTRGWAKPAITGSAVLESSGTGLRGLLCKWFGWFC